MQKQPYLSIEGELLPLPDEYAVDLRDHTGESGGTTEAGTVIRDVVREGIPSIKVKFSVSPQWLVKLSGFKRLPSLTVQYRDPYTGGMVDGTFYIDGYSVTRAHDTADGGLWVVGFTLEDIAGGE